MTSCVCPVLDQARTRRELAEAAENVQVSRDLFEAARKVLHGWRVGIFSALTRDLTVG